MLEGRGLTKVFTSGFFGKRRFFAVRDVDISIKKGEVITLLGESGSGKSTLAKLLCLLSEPTDGDVLLDGFRVTKLRGKELKNFRKKSK